MPVLVDGNNLMHSFPTHDRTRAAVRRSTLELARSEKTSVTVVFDGPAPDGVPERERLGRTTIVYSGAEKADDVIVRSLPAGSSAREWVVVTADRGLADRARRRGAQVRRPADWLRKLMPGARTYKNDDSPLTAGEIADWEAYFSGDS
ncbi:MAG: NYN domain-containing protein [Acidobacteria bacterium]|nr:NYN domain-containing protein [Acidobacteriota bacterium]